MKFLPTFNDVFDDLFHDPWSSNASIDTMRTDIVEKGQTYELSVELPGYHKDDIKIELKNGYLVISANKTIQNEEKDNQGQILRRERYQGSCSRSFYVGEDLIQEDIKATFNNGELLITLPKEINKKQEIKTYIPID